MLVTFSSKVDADVLMMADEAKLVLQAAGKDVKSGISQRGIFTVEQLAQAIKNLEKAIAKDKTENAPTETLEQELDAPEPVILGQRAYPLLSMMRKALTANETIMWETGSGW